MDQLLLCASLSYTHYWYVFRVLGSRCLTGSALLDCHVLKGFDIYMIGILDSLSDVGKASSGSLLHVNYSV